jgi:hypothetical protein
MKKGQCGTYKHKGKLHVMKKMVPVGEINRNKSIIKSLISRNPDISINQVIKALHGMELKPLSKKTVVKYMRIARNGMRKADYLKGYDTAKPQVDEPDVRRCKMIIHSSKSAKTGVMQCSRRCGAIVERTNPKGRFPSYCKQCRQVLRNQQKMMHRNRWFVTK